MCTRTDHKLNLVFASRVSVHSKSGGAASILHRFHISIFEQTLISFDKNKSLLCATFAFRSEMWHFTGKILNPILICAQSIWRVRAAMLYNYQVILYIDITIRTIYQMSLSSLHSISFSLAIFDSIATNEMHLRIIKWWQLNSFHSKFYLHNNNQYSS